MALYGCPKGHQSTESDFCSECGARIQPAAVAPPVESASSGVPCPDCGAPRTDLSSNFCEVCGYNFSTGTHGNVPDGVEAEPAPEPEPVAPPAPAPPVAESKHWTLTIALDPSLRDPDGPEAPVGVASVVMPVDKAVLLIGRKSDKRNIHPEVPLDFDDGVSHRHALLNCDGDGGLTLRDIGSSNGTRLNGAAIKPLEDIQLHDGDQITLGRWTRLTVNTI
jgi:hypothetical protein